MTRRWWTAAIAALVAAAIVVVSAQPGLTRLRAAALLVDGLALPVAEAVTGEVVRRTATVAGVEADVYAVRPGDPVVVLVPGATPAGRADRRAVQLAEALARAGRVVVVPELEVYNEDLVPEDVERIVAIGQAVTDAGHAPVVLVGISFGGSLCLLAAADERIADQVAAVGVFGAYLDLVGVLQAATSGVGLVGEERIPWNADPRAEGIVRDRLVGLLPDELVWPTHRALDGALDPVELPPEARSVYDVLTNEDPTRTYALAAALPADVRARIDAVSPGAVAERIVAPVVAMHATDDPAVPFAELRRLGEALPDATLIAVDSFEHVDLRLGDPSTWPAVAADLLRVWRFATDVLAAQERRWPWSPR